MFIKYEVKINCKNKEILYKRKKILTNVQKTKNNSFKNISIYFILLNKTI